MKGQEKQTMDFVKSLMEPYYTLAWGDYRDNLDKCRDTITK